MENLNWKNAIGVTALCVVGLFGLKDTGIFVTSHTTTLNSGNKLSFVVEEKANIVEEKDNGFVVQKGEAKVTVPKNKIIRVEGDSVNFVVKANAPLKVEGKTVRNLFLGENVTLVEDKGENAVVKAQDGVQGLVSKAVLEETDNTYITKGKAKEDFTVSTNGKQLKAKKGQELSIISFENKKFVVIDENWNTFNVPADKVLLDEKAVPAPAAAPKTEPPVEEEKKAVAINVNVANVNSEVAKKVITSAASKMGTPYVYGATGSSGYDCSGLVYAIYKNELGINLPRTSRSQSTFGTQVAREQLQPGDLVFFNTLGNGVSHVGIYIGDNNFIHASSGQKKVVKNSLNDKYYNKRYVNATRVL